MPADGMRAEQRLDPEGHEAAARRPRLLPWNLNSSTMMARTGTATFHQVIPALTFENSFMPRKLIAVNSAISTTVIAKPSPVTFFVIGL